MGFQISFWVSLSHFLWWYFRNEISGYMVPLFWNFEELLYQYIFLKSYPEVRVMWPFLYLHTIASKHYYSSKFLFLLKKNGVWLYHLILHILPLHPHCQTSPSSSLSTFIDDLGTRCAVLSPFLSPTVVLCGQYPEDYPIPWLSQTSGFHSLITNLYHSIPHSFHVFSYVFETACVVYVYLLTPNNPSLFSSSSVYPVQSRWPFFCWCHKSLSRPLHVVNQLHSSILLWSAFSPLDLLGKIMPPCILEPL